MSVRSEIAEYHGIYFITITCSCWSHLFELADGYDEIYKWFDHLKCRGHYIVGYVIMPNHLHALIGFKNTGGVSINLIIGEGKRFMSYGIVRRLKEKNEHVVLDRLSGQVNDTDRKRENCMKFLNHRLTGKNVAAINFLIKNWTTYTQIHVEEYGIW